MDRRNFIKKTAIIGGCSAAVAGAYVAERKAGRKEAGLGCSSAADAGGNGMQTAESRSGEGAGPAMTFRTNPRDGERISLLGYGCMRWQMIRDSDGRNIIDQDSVNELVDYAIAHGVNYFDSSPVYLEGQSERATGIALSRHPRSSYKIATKLSNFSNSSRENSLLMYRKSFENFQTDYIDYYLLHSLGRSMEDFRKRYVDNGMMDFLLAEREKGHIRNLGFSFHGNREMFDRLIATHEQYHWDFVQIQMNWMDWTHASGRNCNAEHLYGELDRRGIPAVIMEPLLGGRLARVPDYVAQRLKEREPERSVASWAFRFAGTYDRVLTVLSGMTYMEHLQDNLKSFSPLRKLSDSDLEFLEETADIMSRYPTIPCNDCKYCMPCPYGIDIPAVLLHYNKCVNEGLVVSEPAFPGNGADKDALEAYSRDQKAYRKARRAYLVSYDRSLEKVRQADHCIGCGHCVEHCPQQIAIPRELRRISTLVENLRAYKA